jgi:T5SS/PEP-CTERM-associated repeat protein
MKVALRVAKTLLLSGSLVMVCICPVLADSTSWTGDIGSWFAPVNWSAGVPGVGRDAYVDLQQGSGSNATVQIGAGDSAQADIVYLAYSTGTSNSRYLGNMDVWNGGSLVCQGLTLGYNSYSSGIAGISGEHSQVVVNGSGVAIGNYGDGCITVGNYGSLSVLGSGISVGKESGPIWSSRGTLSISTGATVTTTSIFVGQGGGGQLGVLSGATLQSPDGAAIAYGLRATGSSALVSGANSVWDCGSLGVGSYQGTGTLEVKQGGRFNGSSLHVGSLASGGRGTVTISDSPSRISLSGDIMIEAGRLKINNGLVESTRLDMQTTGEAILNGGVFDVGEVDATNGGLYLYGGTLRTSRRWGASFMQNNGSTVDPKDYLLEVLGDPSRPGEYDWYRQSSGTLWIDVDGSPASGLFDRLRANEVSFEGGDLKLDFTYVPAPGTTYQFIEMPTPWIIGGCPVQVSGLPAGYSVNVDFANGTFTVVPEPSAIALLGIGAVLLTLARRRRR